MTRRERMEARLERRRQWAAGRAAKSESAFAAAHRAVEGIPFGQPILVGHHSEKHHRAAVDRMARNMDAGCESAAMAKHHSSKAFGLKAQLEGSIFSDDPDAIEALEAKISGLEESAARANAINKAWRKHKGNAAELLAAWTALGVSEALCVQLAANAREFSWLERTGPMSATGTRAEIRRCKQRIEDVKRRQERAAAAEAAGGCAIEGADYVTVTFPEFPGRSITEALRGAGFHFSGGSWHGRRESLPNEALAFCERGKS